MTYQYGALIAVVSPNGQKVQAQMGEMTPDGPMIHIRSHQMEAPANLLRQEGWQIPEVKAAHHYAVEAARIVDALINDSDLIPGRGLPRLPHWTGKPPKFKAVGRDPYPHIKKGLPRCRNCGSLSHKTDDCPNREVPVV